MVKVAELVESKLELEKEAGCGMCRDNRLLLEKAWQIIANEFYDPSGQYSQAAWAQQLLSQVLPSLLLQCLPAPMLHTSILCEDSKVLTVLEIIS